LGVVLQIGMIYFFTGLWKTVPMLWGESAAWLDGTAIHYVLHMEQSIRTPALWAREMPLWAIRCLSWGTLAIELAALPMFLLPWLQPLLRRVAIAVLLLLHLGIAVTLDAGLFSYVMVASYAVLLTDADWALLRRWLAPLSPPATVYYDDGCGICTRTCEVLAACDRFGRLTFVGSSDRQAYRHAIPEGLVENTVVVFDDRTGRMYTKSRATAKALRALPLPYHLLAWFALPGLHYLSDLAYDAFARNRHRVSQWLGLTMCRVPGRQPTGDETGHPRSANVPAPRATTLPSGSGWLWNLAAGAVLAAVVAANLLENVVGLEQRWRQYRYRAEAYHDPDAMPTPARPTGLLRVLDLLARANEQRNLVTNFAGAIQRWNMFAPDPPKEDEWWVADAVLEDGRHMDPMSPDGFPRRLGREPKETNFLVQPSFRERRYERIWATYLIYAPGDVRPERFRAAEILRREFCRYLVQCHERTAGKGQKIVSLDLYFLRTAMPLPTRDDGAVSALWAADSGPPARVERTVVPRRQGFNPYRQGLLIASYYPGKQRERRYESGTFAVEPGPQPEPDAELEVTRPTPRRMLQSIWFPSGALRASGPRDLDWQVAVGEWTERAPGGIDWRGPYVRGDQPGTSLKDGVWQIYYPTGELKAQGKYDRGQRVGIWHEFYSDGGLYEEVTYAGDKRHGPASRWYRGRTLMERGQYRDDRPDGQWTYWDALGFLSQQGEFASGLRHGQWTAWHRNGKLARREHYEKGVLHGWIVEFLSDGKTLSKQCEMQNGLPHGPWQTFFPNGQLAEEGQNAAGLRTGVWKFYYRSPAPYAAEEQPRLHKQQTYAEGKLHGPLVEYYESGAVLERGEYVANQRQGPWTVWYPDGKPREQGAFRDDQEHGPWTYWYENGQKSREGPYQAGLQEGDWKSYWPDGTPMTAGTFVEGAAHGLWSIWYANGKVKQRGEFADGLQTGHWEIWNEDGTKSAEGDYAAGKKVGTWKTWVKGQETQQTFKDDAPIDAPGTLRAP
jgi:antitoxin component YwqK of YwqJK toxin-antitoxin module/predicted DCC family thiol-disulfide oxidoreductase YuxK